MDKVIVTALLIIGAVSAAVVVIVTIGPSVSLASQSVMEANRQAANRILTDIEVVAVTANASGTRVDAWVKNVGVAAVSPVNKSDVFVVTPSVRFDAMTYSASGDNTWIENPPGASWDRGDTLHITITLPASNPLAVGNHVLKLATANGVYAEKIFSR